MCISYLLGVIISFYKYIMQVFLKLFLHDYIFLKELVRSGTLTLYNDIISLYKYILQVFLKFFSTIYIILFLKNVKITYILLVFYVFFSL